MRGNSGTATGPGIGPTDALRIPVGTRPPAVACADIEASEARGSGDKPFRYTDALFFCAALDAIR